MLVIGIQNKGAPFYIDLDVDPDIDNARSIHDLLAKKAKVPAFEHILCVENDTVVAEFENEVDYDLSEKFNDDSDDSDDDDEEDPDALHEDDEDEDSDD